jgi:hypothetical protein
MSSGKVKVIYRVKSLGIKPGDTAMVDSDVAAQLVANGNALRAAEAPAEAKPSK